MLPISKLARFAIPAVAAIALVTLAAAETTAEPSASRRSQPSATRSTGRSAARPAAPAATAKSPVTISLTSMMRRGNLVVMLDDVPVFNEKFQKPLYIISQTTVWDPVQVTAGKHKLTAKVIGAKGKTYVSGIYELEISRTSGIALRIRTKGDKLTVERSS